MSTIYKKYMPTDYKNSRIKESKNASLSYFFSFFSSYRSLKITSILPGTKNLFTYSLVEHLSSLSHRGIV